jgi:hypothetical protein
MRASGLPGTGSIPSGTHILHYYHHGRELMNAQAGFCRAGLLGGEYCLWIITPPYTAAMAEHEMSQILPSAAEYLDKGQLEFVPYVVWYFDDDHFSSETTVRRTGERLDAARKRGFQTTRICGALSWLETPEQWRAFLLYEQSIHQAVTGTPIIGLCSYPIRATHMETDGPLQASHHAVLRPTAHQWTYVECGPPSGFDSSSHSSSHSRPYNI